MKKFCIITLAFALAVSMAACGCQRQNDMNNGTTATTKATTAPTTTPTTHSTTAPTVIAPTYETNIPDPDVDTNNTEDTHDTTENTVTRKVH